MGAGHASSTRRDVASVRGGGGGGDGRGSSSVGERSRRRPMPHHAGERRGDGPSTRRDASSRRGDGVDVRNRRQESSGSVRGHGDRHRSGLKHPGITAPRTSDKQGSDGIDASYRSRKSSSRQGDQHGSSWGIDRSNRSVGNTARRHHSWDRTDHNSHVHASNRREMADSNAPSVAPRKTTEHRPRIDAPPGGSSIPASKGSSIKPVASSKHSHQSKGDSHQSSRQTLQSSVPPGSGQTDHNIVVRPVKSTSTSHSSQRKSLFK
jgi:hypothetical protein